MWFGGDHKLAMDIRNPMCGNEYHDLVPMVTYAVNYAASKLRSRWASFDCRLVDNT